MGQLSAEASMKYMKNQEGDGRSTRLPTNWTRLTLYNSFYIEPNIYRSRLGQKELNSSSFFLELSLLNFVLLPSSIMKYSLILSLASVVVAIPQRPTTGPNGEALPKCYKTTEIKPQADPLTPFKPKTASTFLFKGLCLSLDRLPDLV
jgi:hypothetical protein